MTASSLVLAISMFQTSFLIRGIGLVAIAILAATGKTVEEPPEEGLEGDKGADRKNEETPKDQDAVAA